MLTFSVVLHCSTETTGNRFIYDIYDILFKAIINWMSKVTEQRNGQKSWCDYLQDHEMKKTATNNGSARILTLHARRGVWGMGV